MLQLDRSLVLWLAAAEIRRNNTAALDWANFHKSNRDVGNAMRTWRLWSNNKSQINAAEEAAGDQVHNPHHALEQSPRVVELSPRTIEPL